MSYDFILGIDPSGAFREGKGTTGWCVLSAEQKAITKVDQIEALKFCSQEEYWKEHLHVIKTHKNKYKKRMCVVIEDYLLYSQLATSQTNSRFETCQLIGVMKYFCFANNIKYVMQTASQVKQRWSDKILVHKGVIIPNGKGYITSVTKHPINEHCRDAIRHAWHFNTFKNKED